MDKWIVVEVNGDEVKVCKTEEEAKQVAHEWIVDDYIHAEDIEIFKVISKYKVKATVELTRVEEKIKKDVRFKEV